MEITGDVTAKNKALKFLRQWEDDSLIIHAHTSGSTGIPKDIQLLKSDMKLSAEATCRFFNINSKSVLYLPLSPDYIAGKMMIVRAAVAGAKLIVETPSSTPRLSIPENTELDLAAIVPSQLPAVLESPQRLQIRNLIIGGAPLSEKMEARLLCSGIRNSFVTYGMTETCSHVALRHVGLDSYEALPGFDFATDSRGCLIISSEDMSFNKITTNDLVALNSTKSFRWLGRFDNVINSGGIKVFPEQIEQRIAHYIPDRDFFIASRASEKWGDEVVLVIEGEKEIPGLEENLKETLKPAERPKEIFYQNQFERTSSGKIKRIIKANVCV